MPGEIGRALRRAGGFVVGAFPAFPHAEDRRVVLVEDIGAGGDPGVEAGLFLQFAERQHQRHAGVGAGDGQGLGLGGRPQADAGKRQQPDRDDRQQDHQRERDDQGKARPGKTLKVCRNRWLSMGFLIGF